MEKANRQGKEGEAKKRSGYISLKCYAHDQNYIYI